MSDELKPCPFCGNEPKHVTRPFLDDSDGGDKVDWHFIKCSGALSGAPPICDIQPTTNGFTSFKAAAESWNRRAAVKERGEDTKLLRPTVEQIIRRALEAKDIGIETNVRVAMAEYDCEALKLTDGITAAVAAMQQQSGGTH